MYVLYVNEDAKGFKECVIYNLRNAAYRYFI